MSHMALGFTIFMLSREYKITALAFFTKWGYYFYYAYKWVSGKQQITRSFRLFEKIDSAEI